MNERRGLEWQTLGLIVACHGLWLLAGWCWAFADNGLTALVVLAVLAVVSAFHTSLQHETIHGHPTNSGVLNEALVFFPLAWMFPYRRYRDLHLKHHNDLNLTDPYEDPESYFWPLQQFVTMRPAIRAGFAANNTLVGRLLLGPGLSIIGFARTEARRLLANESGVRLAWLLHLAGLIPVILIIIFVFNIPLWVYAMCVVYPALSLTSLRSYAEHQAAENVGARSAIVETVAPMALLYLNNNLHIVHHASPSTPWYEIPDLYRERKDQYLAANEHLLFDGYSDIAKRFAFSVKQQVDHPFLYRETEAPD